MNCEYCQSPIHIWFQCPKKPDGWKPARLAKKREPAPSSDCKSGALTKEGLAAASSNLGAPTKSTAARKVVPALDPLVPEEHALTAGRVRAKRGKAHEIGDSPVGERSGTRGETRQRVAEISAGTQALPVDTNSLQTQKASSGNADGGKPLTQTRPANSAGSSNGRTAGFDPVNAGSTPAPASKFDKKAWMKAYMKTYIRQYRKDVKGGKRTPKPRA